MGFFFFSPLSSSFSSIFSQLASHPADVRGLDFDKLLLFGTCVRWFVYWFVLGVFFLMRSASGAKRQVLSFISQDQVLGGRLIFSLVSLLLCSTWGKGLHFTACFFSPHWTERTFCISLSRMLEWDLFDFSGQQGMWMGCWQECFPLTRCAQSPI